ncbi:MAG: CoB--CoM heterodisulfide reductase iron-sulfur subunit B family protein [Syntrophobacteraceae bacterium]|nr:CoB--CoM heterodisulfide reductase iron-sulfur subunit B family protein [Syntrophobacteraceae bacterium]
MKATYYPGCSLEGASKDYADSIECVCAQMGIELQEVPDWNCCGATAAHSINRRASIELPLRNLRLARTLGNPDMLVPCPLCFNRLKTAVHGSNDPGAAFPGIWDLAAFFATDERLRELAEGVKKRLEGLNVVSYYGCMSSRPPEITGAADYENPQSIDRIVKTLGATPIDWPYKTDCCGASLIVSMPGAAFKMVEKLLDMARRVGAEAVVVSCQMCQGNLDMYQDRIEADTGKRFGLPIIYFTELIGLAWGLAESRGWLSRHFVDPVPLLRSKGLMAAER